MHTRSVEFVMKETLGSRPAEGTAPACVSTAAWVAVVIKTQH